MTNTKQPTQDEQEAEKLYLADTDNKPFTPFSEQDKSVRDFYLMCAEGIKEGMKARKEGRVKPWSEVKKELNIQ